MIFPDVEATLVDYLDTQLEVPVSLNIPDERPEKFVTVSRNGGSAQFNTVPFLDRAMIFVEAFAQTDQAAFDLINEVHAQCYKLISQRYKGVQFNRMQEFASKINSPDISGQPRYNSSIEFRVRPVYK